MSAAGLDDLPDGLTVPSPNAGAKAVSVVGGMLAGADSIDDLDVLRHGGMARLLLVSGLLRRWARSCACSPTGKRVGAALARAVSEAQEWSDVDPGGPGDPPIA